MSDVDRLLDAIMPDHKTHQFEGILAKPYDMEGFAAALTKQRPS
jgi:hypothetical protein